MEGRGGEVCVKQEDQHQPLEVYYEPGSSLSPPPGFASTAMMGSNVPLTDTRDLESQREQDMEEMRREQRRVASRDFRKRKKATFEHLEASCKEKDHLIDQLSQKIKKLETEIALMKDNQNEAMKILAGGLQRDQTN